MKTLVTAFACAALAAGSLIAAPAAFAQSTSAQTYTTTTSTAHTYHSAYGAYGYAHRTYGYKRVAAAGKPCDGAYGSCGPYLAGRSEDGSVVDMDYQAPIGTPIYANGDVQVDCSCDHRH